MSYGLLVAQVCFLNDVFALAWQNESVNRINIPDVLVVYGDA